MQLIQGKLSELSARGYRKKRFALSYISANQQSQEIFLLLKMHFKENNLKITKPNLLEIIL